jgi:DNA-binding protein HU-beta
LTCIWSVGISLSKANNTAALKKAAFSHSLIKKGECFVNKAELIDAVAEGADISKAAATRAVDTFIDSITNSLKNGDQVTLVGFGTFSVRPRAARQGRNPRTGETINIPASNNPAFKAGKALKDAVN